MSLDLIRQADALQASLDRQTKALENVENWRRKFIRMARVGIGLFLVSILVGATALSGAYSVDRNLQRSVVVDKHALYTECRSIDRQRMLRERLMNDIARVVFARQTGEQQKFERAGDKAYASLNCTRLVRNPRALLKIVN